MTAEDIGLDLDHARDLPECQACRKKSDSYRRCTDGTVLCGSHYDEFLRYTPVRWSAKAFAAFLAETRYAACWKTTP